MDYIAIGIVLIKHPREEDGAIKARIERTHLIDGAAPHTHFTQFGVPLIGSLLFDGLKILIADFTKVELGLFVADERGCHLGLYLIAAVGDAESDDGPHVVGLYLQPAVYQRRIGKRADLRKRLVEYDYEVVFEVVGHAAAVACGITDDGILFRYDFDI